MESTIKAVKEGKTESYRDIVIEYQKSIYRYISTMVNNSVTAEDLTQDVFTTAYYKIESYKADTSFKAWLYKIAKNITLNYMKKANNEERLFYRMNDITPKVHEDVYEEELYDIAIENTLNQLKKDEKHLLILRAVEELSYEELSVVFATTPSNVRKKYERVKKKFRLIYDSSEGGEQCQILI